jgi:hypothetical protein
VFGEEVEQSVRRFDFLIWVINLGRQRVEDVALEVGTDRWESHCAGGDVIPLTGNETEHPADRPSVHSPAGSGVRLAEESIRYDISDAHVRPVAIRSGGSGPGR